MKYKIFVLQSEFAEDMGEIIKREAKGLGFDVELQTEQKSNFSDLPKNCDFYFIHLNDLDSIITLEQIKKQQPKSYFIEMGVGGGYFKGEKRLTRENSMLFHRKKIEKILMELTVK